jgi:hypothetical protein
VGGKGDWRVEFYCGDGISRNAKAREGLAFSGFRNTADVGEDYFFLPLLRAIMSSRGPLM